MLKIITSPNPLGYLLLATIAKRNLDAIEAARDANPDEDPKGLDAMAADLCMNTRKQGWVLTTSLLLAVWYVYDVGSAAVLQNGLLWNIATGLTVAWFVVTFSSVKEIFLDSATVLTYFMFTAFTLPWMAVTLAVAASPELGMAEKVITSVAVVFAWVAAAIYDSLDLLRGNMDELAVEFFKRGAHGLLSVEIEKNG